jgi:hypothetical protein
MPRFEDSIEIAAPVRETYDQWTQFEEFPQFMEGVERVVQVDDKHLEWTAKVAGRDKTWTAEITDQTPDTRVAWKSTSGAENAGAVLFERCRTGSDTGHAEASGRPGGAGGDRRRERRPPRATGEGRSRAIPRPDRDDRPGERRLAWRDPRRRGPEVAWPRGGRRSRSSGQGPPSAPASGGRDTSVARREGPAPGDSLSTRRAWVLWRPFRSPVLHDRRQLPKPVEDRVTARAHHPVLGDSDSRLGLGRCPISRSGPTEITRAHRYPARPAIRRTTTTHSLGPLFSGSQLTCPGRSAWSM